MRTDLVWRALVPVAAVAALLLDAPQAVTGGLALAGLALAAERLAGLRRRGVVDALLVGTGGVVVVVVLTGMLLGSTPVGLDPTTWTVAVVVLGLAGLVVAALLPARVPVGATPARVDRRAVLLALPWLGAAVAVAVVSVQMSATSLSVAEEPPVEVSFGQVSGTEVEVVVSSSEAIGPLEVRTSAEGNDVSYPLSSVPADGTTTTTVLLPAEGRYVITVGYPDQTQPLRTLVLDR